MIIGLDFDNTIIAYDDVFRAAACARELIRSDDGLRRKREIRDAIRRSPDGERKWQDLQGFVYGRGIVDARLFDGVEDFLRRCRDGGHRVLIISHKTRYGHFDPTGTDLREAALDWMEARGFFERGALGITRGDVSFHDTRADKLRGIAKLGCTHFIDDLEEVLSDPSFPRDVERILFGECSATPSCRGYPSYPTWSEISAAFFSTAAVPSFAGRESGAPEPDRTLSTDVAMRLVGGPVDSIEPAGQGRNSRVYRVVSAGRPFALKHYLRTHRDKRDRLGTEVDALEMLQRGAEPAVPRVVAVDRQSNCIAMTWIDGSPITDVTDSDIDQALSFLGTVRLQAPTAAFPPSRLASEACLCGAEIERQIDDRLARLRTVSGSEPELRAFLEDSYAATRAHACRRARAGAGEAGLEYGQPLSPDLRALIPADFGFHNSLRRPDGSVVFVDFEYFGWDDPVKLTADVLLHPGSRLSAAQRMRFRSGAERLYSSDSGFGARLGVLYPLFALRWTLILLNEFLPDRWQRRIFAACAGEWREAKVRQLDRAISMLREVERT